MIVVIANNLPDAIRGRLKLWFIEPRPNIFVSGVKDSVADKVVDYLLEHCPPESGVTIFKRSPKPPGYRIFTLGMPKRRLNEISGMQLVVEKEENKTTF